VADSEDDLCRWLEEAIGTTPREWKVDQVVDFKNFILGVTDMGDKLVVRDCYIKMKEEIATWLKEMAKAPTGLFVVTGTPGTGKSVFLAFVAAYFAEENKSAIVIQRGNRWWSRPVAGKTVSHGETKPLGLLDSSETLLLADPIGGENKAAVEYRAQGCTIVFTSPSHTSYHSAWSQLQRHSTKRFMPIWKAAEVWKHAAALFEGAELDRANVEDAYAKVGGCVRWLQRVLVKKQEAKKILAKYITCSDVSHLSTIVKRAVSTPDNLVNPSDSRMSYMFQMDSEADFTEDNMKMQFVDSEVAVDALTEKLKLHEQEKRLEFITTFVAEGLMGSLVGKFFEKHVKHKLTADGEVQLRYTPIGNKGSKEQTVKIPSNFEELKTRDKVVAKTGLIPDKLYNPSSEVFAAADLFFVTGSSSQTLWLLQITKAETHDCKIGALHATMTRYFRDLNNIQCIKWIVVAPACINLSAYKRAPQVVHGAWTNGTKKLDVEQHVSPFDMKA
ncbi:CRN16, partial [Symbiodinium necroappetens]